MKDFKAFMENQSIDEVLDEAIRPKQTDYGTNFPDLNNGQYKDVNHKGFDFVSTAFDGDDRWVTVDIVNNSTVMFRTYPKTTALKAFDDLMHSARFNGKAFRGNANAISILKKVLFIGLQKLKDNQEFSFSSEDKALIRLYRMIIKSRAFKEEMSKLGFEISKLDDEDSRFDVTYKKVTQA